MTLKLARTADGYAGAPHGPRLLITGEAANARVHLMRAHHDAIMVGIGTVARRRSAASPCACRGSSIARRSASSSTRSCACRRPRGWCATAHEVPTWIVAAATAPVAAEQALVRSRRRGDARRRRRRPRRPCRGAAAPRHARADARLQRGRARDRRSARSRPISSMCVALVDEPASSSARRACRPSARSSPTPCVERFHAHRARGARRRIGSISFERAP